MEDECIRAYLEVAVSPQHSVALSKFSEGNVERCEWTSVTKMICIEATIVESIQGRHGVRNYCATNVGNTIVVVGIVTHVSNFLGVPVVKSQMMKRLDSLNL